VIVKITDKDHSVTIDSKTDYLSVYDAANLCRYALLAIGYAPSNVDEVIQFQETM
jgi:hypothetical protein